MLIGTLEEAAVTPVVAKMYHNAKVGTCILDTLYVKSKPWETNFITPLADSNIGYRFEWKPHHHILTTEPWWTHASHAMYMFDITAGQP